MLITPTFKMYGSISEVRLNYSASQSTKQVNKRVAPITEKFRSPNIWEVEVLFYYIVKGASLPHSLEIPHLILS